MRGLVLLAFAIGPLCAGCSGGSASAALDGVDATSVPEVVATTTNGALRFGVTDFATVPGIMWTLPQATVTDSSVVVRETRYGSLCQFDVAGSASVRPNAVDLHVRFGERLTSCVAQVRALRYQAEIT